MFIVRVPVLSEHRMDMPAISSMAARRATVIGWDRKERWNEGVKKVKIIGRRHGGIRGDQTDREGEEG